MCDLVIVSCIRFVLRTLGKKHIFASTKMGIYEPKVFEVHPMESENEDNETGGRAKK